MDSGIKWEVVSHVTYDKSFVRTECGLLSGREIFKHIQTRRRSDGLPVGEPKETYSLTLNGDQYGWDDFLDMIISKSIPRMFDDDEYGEATA